MKLVYSLERGVAYLMSVSKHRRESGAITVKKNGKIIGNMGSGKINIPTARKDTIEERQSGEKISLITQKAEQFAVIQQNLTESETQQEITSDHVATLWEITNGQPLEARITMLANLMSDSNREIVRDYYQHTIIKNGFAASYYDQYRDLDNVAKKTDNPQLLDLLSTSDRESIWWAVLNNVNISTETLSSLAKDKNFEKKCRLVWCHNLPPEIFTQLAKDRSVKVRTAVASAKVTPIDVLQSLENDKNQTVRHALAENPNTPPSTLALIIENSAGKVIDKSEWSIRIQVASNPNTPTETLKMLVDEGTWWVCDRAKKTLQERQKINKG